MSITRQSQSTISRLKNNLGIYQTGEQICSPVLYCGNTSIPQLDKHSGINQIRVLKIIPAYYLIYGYSEIGCYGIKSVAGAHSVPLRHIFVSNRYSQPLPRIYSVGKCKTVVSCYIINRYAEKLCYSPQCVARLNSINYGCHYVTPFFFAILSIYEIFTFWVNTRPLNGNNIPQAGKIIVHYIDKDIDKAIRSSLKESQSGDNLNICLRQIYHSEAISYRIAIFHKFRKEFISFLMGGRL